MLVAIEWIGFACGLATVWLTAQMRVASWPIGLASVTCFAILFFEARLYANSFLQLVFLALGVTGWRRWRSAGSERTRLDVRRATARERLGLAAAAIASSALAGIALAATDSPAPYADAAVFALSLAATWAQAARWIECWPIWIAVDVIAIPLYVNRDLVPTAALYGVFLLLCIFGWRLWRAQLR